MATVEGAGYNLPHNLQQPTTFNEAESQVPPSQRESAGNSPFEFQIFQIDRIIQIKTHNRDLVARKNCCYSECGSFKNNANGNLQKLNGINTINHSGFNNQIFKNNGIDSITNNGGTNVSGVNSKGRRQNQNSYHSPSTQYQPNPNVNSMNSNSQGFINNNQRKFNYMNTNYNKKIDQPNFFPNVNMSINSSMNLLQQLQKQQHQQQFEQQQSQYQYNYGSNQNVLDSFLVQQLNSQSQVQQSQYQQQAPTFQNHFNYSQNIPAQTYGAQSPLLFDYNLNTNKDFPNTNSLLANNNNSTNSLLYNNSFSNTNNVLFQHQKNQPSGRATLDALPQLNLQSIIDTGEMVSNVTTPGSISRPNSSITSIGSSAPSSHVNSDNHENHSSTSNISSKSTLVDPLESIWKRDRDSSGKNSQALHDISFETKYFDDPDKLKDSGLLGKYFS